jgi:hypothetical protein
MIPSSTQPAGHLQARFLAILPRIERYARFHSQAIRCAVKKADFVAEAVAVCWRWFVRLAERGKDGATFVSAMASLAARHVKAGRGLCGQERGRDVLSYAAQRRHGFRVKALPTTTRRFEAANDGGLVEQQYDLFEDRLRDNTHTPVPDQAAFRIDWPAFLATLSGRDRRLAGYLSVGHSAKAAAAKFGLSPGRVTQLRQQWCRDWRALEDPDAAERRCRLNGTSADAAVA